MSKFVLVCANCKHTDHAYKFIHFEHIVYSELTEEYEIGILCPKCGETEDVDID